MSEFKEEIYQFNNLRLSDKFLNETSKLAAIIGVDDKGQPILFDFAENPHLFIGGDQGCGKSTLIHSIIMSLMQRNTPDEFQFVYFDEKHLEANLYSNSKFLFTYAFQPVNTLRYIKKETSNRLNLLSNAHKRSLLDYNQFADSCDDIERIPELFIFIDELSLIIEQEGISELIEALFINARTVGIHFVVSDSNPTLKNVLRIAKIFPQKILLRFTLADYKALLGKMDIVPVSDDGEILCDFGGDNLIHGHASFVSIDEVKEKVSKNLDDNIVTKKKIDTQIESIYPILNDDDSDLWDPLLSDAAVFAVKNKGSNTYDLQKHLKLGYARASRVMDQLEEKGIISCSQGAKPRELLVNSVEEIKEALGEEYAIDDETELTLFTETVVEETVVETTSEENEETTGEQADNSEKTSKIDRFSLFLSRSKNIVICIIVAFIAIMAIYNVLNIPRETVDKIMSYVVGYGFFPALIIFCVWILKGKRKRGKRYNIYAIDNLSDGHDFEYVVADLLKNVGFYNVKVTVGSGDYGIDVVGWYDGVSYAIQCKMYSNKVGISAVQEAYSGRSYYGCDYAVVITNNYFTPAAINLAKSTGVILWDRTMVKRLLNGHL